VDLPSYKMVIFHSFVILPEGISHGISMGFFPAFFSPDDVVLDAAIHRQDMHLSLQLRIGFLWAENLLLLSRDLGD